MLEDRSIKLKVTLGRSLLDRIKALSSSHKINEADVIFHILLKAACIDVAGLALRSANNGAPKLIIETKITTMINNYMLNKADEMDLSKHEVVIAIIESFFSDYAGDLFGRHRDERKGVTVAQCQEIISHAFYVARSIDGFFALIKECDLEYSAYGEGHVIRRSSTSEIVCRASDAGASYKRLVTHFGGPSKTCPKQECI